MHRVIFYRLNVLLVGQLKMKYPQLIQVGRLWNFEP